MNDKRPNVILLVLDALRAKNLSCYGYPRATTPCLDRFARDNLQFRRAFSAATWTVPAHASLLSGLHLSQHRIESIETKRQFHPEIVTLPEALRRHGYRTAAFSQNMLFSPEQHLDQGFEEFHQIDEILRADWLTRRIQQVADRPQGRGRMVARYLRKMLAPRRLLMAMRDWVADQEAGRPFFLMANVLVPHFPWTVPPRLLVRSGAVRPSWLLKREYLTLKDQWDFNSGKKEVTDAHRDVWRRLYDAAVMHADQEVGNFLEQLAHWAGYNNTIVIVTADHGEMLGDYRSIVGHLLCLHDNLIHVPLLVRHPNHRPCQVQQVVQTTDLYPSILEWTGCPMHFAHPAQVRRPALSQAIANPSREDGYAVAEEDYTDSYDVIGKLKQANPAMDPNRYPRQQVAVRSAKHKYIWRGERAAELYDLQSDPEEQHDLIRSGEAEPDVLTKLQAEFESWRQNLEIFPPVEADSAADLDEITLERLRALGYVL